MNKSVITNAYNFVFFATLHWAILTIFPKRTTVQQKMPNWKGTGPCTKKGQISPEHSTWSYTCNRKFNHKLRISFSPCFSIFKCKDWKRSIKSLLSFNNNWKMWQLNSCGTSNNTWVFSLWWMTLVWKQRYLWKLLYNQYEMLKKEDNIPLHPHRKFLRNESKSNVGGVQDGYIVYRNLIS